MPPQSQSRFDQQGKYRSAVGTEELQGDHGVELAIDPSYKNLEGYEDGDDVSLKIMGRLGPAGEDGKRSIEVTSCEVEPMPEAATKFRRDDRSGMPPPETVEED